MAQFDQMQQQVAAVQSDLQQMSETKAHVEQLFKDGFLFRDETGAVSMPANEEIRQ